MNLKQILPLFLLFASTGIFAKPSPKSILAESSKGVLFSQNENLNAFENSDHLSIVAVGDVLLHKPLHVQGLKNNDGFISLWKNLKTVITRADMAYANLEGPVAPGVTSSGKVTKDPGEIFDNRVYTSYPMFNYHEELVEDLVKTGFDVVSTANNHAMDRQSLGVDKTIETLNKYGLQFTGTKTQQDADSGRNDWFTIVERNNFRVAWISCTFSTNGIPDRHHQVLSCFEQSREINEIIRSLSKDRRVDAIIVTPHTGVEYEDIPRQESVNLYRSFIEAGALAVLGAHPHVLQPWEKYVSSNGKEGLIIYSLGNFVSGQFQKLKTRATLLLYLDLIRSPNGTTSISKVQYLPLEMTSSGGSYTVMPMTDRTGTTAIYNHVLGMFGTENLFNPYKNSLNNNSARTLK